MHPTKDIDTLCVDCQLPLCSKCLILSHGEHGSHELIDLETVYADKIPLCFDEISKVDKYYLQTSHDIHKVIKCDATEIQMSMESL
jgi:hypothetical protein